MAFVRDGLVNEGMGVSSKDVGTPTPPSMMHNYQRNRLTKWAFHKRLILNSMFLVFKQGEGAEVRPKKKSGSKLPQSE